MWSLILSSFIILSSFTFYICSNRLLLCVNVLILSIFMQCCNCRYPWWNVAWLTVLVIIGRWLTVAWLTVCTPEGHPVWCDHHTGTHCCWRHYRLLLIALSRLHLSCNTCMFSVTFGAMLAGCQKRHLTSTVFCSNNPHVLVVVVAVIATAVITAVSIIHRQSLIFYNDYWTVFYAL